MVAIAHRHDSYASHGVLAGIAPAMLGSGGGGAGAGGGATEGDDLWGARVGQGDAVPYDCREGKKLENHCLDFFLFCLPPKMHMSSVLIA